MPWAKTAAFIAPAEVPEIALDLEPVRLEQPVEHAPGEGAVRPAALQRQVDRQRRSRRATGTVRALRACQASQPMAIPSLRNWMPMKMPSATRLSSGLAIRNTASRCRSAR